MQMKCLILFIVFNCRVYQNECLTYLCMTAQEALQWQCRSLKWERVEDSNLAKVGLIYPIKSKLMLLLSRFKHCFHKLLLLFTGCDTIFQWPILYRSKYSSTQSGGLSVILSDWLILKNIFSLPKIIWQANNNHKHTIHQQVKSSEITVMDLGPVLQAGVELWLLSISVNTTNSTKSYFLLVKSQVVKEKNTNLQMHSICKVMWHNMTMNMRGGHSSVTDQCFYFLIAAEIPSPPPSPSERNKISYPFSIQI